MSWFAQGQMVRLQVGQAVRPLLMRCLCQPCQYWCGRSTAAQPLPQCWRSCLPASPVRPDGGSLPRGKPCPQCGTTRPPPHLSGLASGPLRLLLRERMTTWVSCPSDAPCACLLIMQLADCPVTPSRRAVLTSLRALDSTDPAGRRRSLEGHCSSRLLRARAVCTLLRCVAA